MLTSALRPSLRYLPQTLLLFGLLFLIEDVSCDVVHVEDEALECCLKVIHHRIPKRIVACYREQLRGDGCLISAVVFRTRKGRDLCAPPDTEWVSELMDAVDARPVKKYKNDLCQGMKGA